MSHDYEDIENEWALRNIEQDKLIQKMTPDQQAAAILKSELVDAKAKFAEAKIELSTTKKRLSKLSKVKVSKQQIDCASRILSHHASTEVLNKVRGKNWDKDTGWF